MELNPVINNFATLTIIYVDQVNYYSTVIIIRIDILYNAISYRFYEITQSLLFSWTNYNTALNIAPRLLQPPE